MEFDWATIDMTNGDMTLSVISCFLLLHFNEKPAAEGDILFYRTSSITIY